MAGMQRDKAPLEWPEAKAGNRLRDRCLDGCYGNRNKTYELEERKAPSSARGTRPGT